jgi:hypothetical protein
MNNMTATCANQVAQLEHFLSHTHMDTHQSCTINSAFEVDELLLDRTITQKQRPCLKQTDLVCRLGMVSKDKAA